MVFVFPSTRNLSDKETGIIRTADRDGYIMQRPISRVISLQSEERAISPV